MPDNETKMSLRDELAARAMHVAWLDLARSEDAEEGIHLDGLELEPVSDVYTSPKNVAIHAYAFADALLARGKELNLYGVDDYGRPLDKDGWPIFETWMWKHLDKLKAQRAMSQASNPEAAARETLAYLLAYFAFSGRTATRPPELVTPEQHKAYRDELSDRTTWGVTWEDGPNDWGVRLSLGAELEGVDDRLTFPTTRQGCYAEPYHGFDLFFWPVRDAPTDDDGR